MILSALILLLIPVIMIIAILKTKGKIRVMLFSLLLTMIILIPICLHYSRTGYIAPALGSFLNLVAPPSDLFDPITTEEKLTPKKDTYEFKVLHKYPGAHTVGIIFSTQQQELPSFKDVDFRVSLTIRNMNKIIYEVPNLKTNNAYIGGINFANYFFPNDVSERTEILAIVKIDGDVQKFIDKYGDATITIKKSHDL